MGDRNVLEEIFIPENVTSNLILNMGIFSYSCKCENIPMYQTPLWYPIPILKSSYHVYQNYIRKCSWVEINTPML